MYVLYAYLNGDSDIPGGGGGAAFADDMDRAAGNLERANLHAEALNQRSETLLARMEGVKEYVGGAREAARVSVVQVREVSDAILDTQGLVGEAAASAGVSAGIAVAAAGGIRASLDSMQMTRVDLGTLCFASEAFKVHLKSYVQPESIKRLLVLHRELISSLPATAGNFATNMELRTLIRAIPIGDQFTEIVKQLVKIEAAATNKTVHIRLSSLEDLQFGLFRMAMESGDIDGVAARRFASGMRTGIGREHAIIVQDYVAGQEKDQRLTGAIATTEPVLEVIENRLATENLDDDTISDLNRKVKAGKLQIEEWSTKIEENKGRGRAILARYDDICQAWVSRYDRM